jgi:hypothetical protein
MFVITKLTLANNNVEIIGAYDDITLAKAQIHDLNKNDEISYRDNKMKFIKVYRKSFFREYPIYIYKILKVPHVLKSVNIKLCDESDYIDDNDE